MFIVVVDESYLRHALQDTNIQKDKVDSMETSLSFSCD